MNSSVKNVLAIYGGYKLAMWAVDTLINRNIKNILYKFEGMQIVTNTNTNSLALRVTLTIENRNFWSLNVRRLFGDIYYGQTFLGRLDVNNLKLYRNEPITEKILINLNLGQTTSQIITQVASGGVFAALRLDNAAIITDLGTFNLSDTNIRLI